MRWFYYYPTFTKPSGGNKQIRLLASLLPDLGVEALLLRDRKFFEEPSRYEDNSFSKVPVPHASFPFEEGGQNLRPDDVVILPEVVLGKSLDVCGSWQCRLALYNQNGFYGLSLRGPIPRFVAAGLSFSHLHRPLHFGPVQNLSWHSPGEDFSYPRLGRASPSFTARRVTRRKTLAVCYMPRKMPDQVKCVWELVQRSHPDVPWVEIDGLPEAEVAVRYRENKIFFAAQDLEGCPLTALEAMACGCLVAGFPRHRPIPPSLRDPGQRALGLGPQRPRSCRGGPVRHQRGSHGRVPVSAVTWRPGARRPDVLAKSR